ncbi:MAG: hypothetical protein J0M26_29510 [Planctomycetes bacterium]|nr:hypothetical protein [Planctomycetota bacterium]
MPDEVSNRRIHFRALRGSSYLGRIKALQSLSYEEEVEIGECLDEIASCLLLQLRDYDRKNELHSLFLHHGILAFANLFSKSGPHQSDQVHLQTLLRLLEEYLRSSDDLPISAALTAIRFSVPSYSKPLIPLIEQIRETFDGNLQAIGHFERCISAINAH